jgi:hypothetical protein
MGNRNVSVQNREIYHRSHSPGFLGNQEETRIKPWCQLSQRNFLYYSISQFLWLPGNISDLSGTTRFISFWLSRLAWRLHHRFLLGFSRRNRKVTVENREIYHRLHSPGFLGNQEETRIKPWCQLSQRNFLYYSFQ